MAGQCFAMAETEDVWGLEYCVMTSQGLCRRRSSSDSMERSQSPFPGPSGPATGLRGMVSSALQSRRGQALDGQAADNAAADRSACPSALQCMNPACLAMLREFYLIKILMRMRCKAGALSLAYAGMTMHGLRLWVSRTCSWDLSRMLLGEMQKSARPSGQLNLSAGKQLPNRTSWT